MKILNNMRGIIDFRKQAKKLVEGGYHRIEADWRLQRGGLVDDKFKIEDVQISTDRKYLYYKLNQTCFDHDAKMERMRQENEQRSKQYQ